MRIQQIIISSLAASLFITNSVNAADSISIEPGMWEMTSTMTTPMFPQPRVETVKECMTEEKISPKDLLDAEDTGECQITESNVSGNSMTWAMQCNNPGGTMTGSGNFTSKGDSASGSMNMNMNFEGQSISMEMSWEGKRIGSC